MSLLAAFFTFNTPAMEGIDVKQFLARHQVLGSFREEPSLPGLIRAEVEHLGFESVRVVAVGPYPVWAVAARLGASKFDRDYIVRVAMKRLAQNLGFKLHLRDIAARVRGECVQAAFCLGTAL